MCFNNFFYPLSCRSIILGLIRRGISCFFLGQVKILCSEPLTKGFETVMLLICVSDCQTCIPCIVNPKVEGGRRILSFDMFDNLMCVCKWVGNFSKFLVN